MMSPSQPPLTAIETSMQSRGLIPPSQTPSARTLAHHPLAAIYHLLRPSLGETRPLPGLAARESATEREADRTAFGKTTCSAIAGVSSAGRSTSLAVHKTMLPYQPKKTHTTICITSLNCRSSILNPSALSPRAKALARDASHPEVVMSGIPWPDLEAGQSQPRAEFLGSSAVHTPSVLSIPGRVD
jgi:hypothetical protein